MTSVLQGGNGICSKLQDVFADVVISSSSDSEYV